RKIGVGNGRKRGHHAGLALPAKFEPAGDSVNDDLRYILAATRRLDPRRGRAGERRGKTSNAVSRYVGAGGTVLGIDLRAVGSTDAAGDGRDRDAGKEQRNAQAADHEAPAMPTATATVQWY